APAGILLDGMGGWDSIQGTAGKRVRPTQVGCSFPPSGSDPCTASEEVTGAMKATLTYLAPPPEQGITIELVNETTIVGRGSLHELGLRAVASQIMRWDYFLVCVGGTLYVGIPAEIHMSRSHFAIRRVPGESGDTFMIRDLETFSGFRLNGTPI